MSNETELLARIKLLEHENSALQQAVDELQRKYQFCDYPVQGSLPISFPSSPLGYISTDFWEQPADNFWNLPKRRARRRNTLFNDFKHDFPWLATDGDLTFGRATMVAEDSPEDDEEKIELKQKVSELKEKIEKLEKKLKDSPFKYVVEAIKDKARYDSPSAAYDLFEKMDYIFRKCEQWTDNVKELKDFLLREKYKALQPPSPSVNYPTEQQMADAISSICGEGKALNDKQKWLGVCCLVRAKYGYPYDIEACCNRLAALPYKAPLYKECDYGSVRKLAVYGFSREPYDKWAAYRPNDTERKHFDTCFNVARELESAIEKMTNND